MFASQDNLSFHYNIINEFLHDFWSNINSVTITICSITLMYCIIKHSYVPYSEFCLWGPNLCELCDECHGLAHFNSTVTLNAAIVLVVSQLCTLLYLMSSKCRYLVNHRCFTEQLRILAVVMTVQHFNRYSAIKLYHHPCEGVIIGIAKRFYFRHHWVQKWQFLCNHVIWWMNGLVDIIIAEITAGQRNRCFAEIGPHKIPLAIQYSLQAI